MEKAENLKVIVTGCGFKPINHIYKYDGKPTHDEILINGTKHKMNIGTATAYYLCKKGIDVILVSRTKSKLEQIVQGLELLGCDKNKISYIPADIATDKGIDFLIKNLPKKSHFYWVQSIGMGAGSYKLKNDNIYLPFEKISPELITAEMNIVTATHRMMLKIIKLFRKQVKNRFSSKICIISSMSGERGYHFGATHVAAKHALVGYIKGIEKELEDENIDIYDVRPGGIDTGMYDNKHVQKSVGEISRRTKMWQGKNPIYSNPINVAKKVYHALFSGKPKKVYRVLAPHQK
ncbi:MAG: SDR family NAD(P)-dependent oxidoreductase [Xanthomonadales bacterium]|nr:SDR family NAD(P)-dependent oxidoreductase [Xanthomonadales bacterium]